MSRKIWLAVSLTVAMHWWAGPVLCLVVRDLSDSDWTATNANKSIKINATVPGSIYTDLMRAGVIGDPYYRFNDDVYRWVAHDNWTFTGRFYVEKLPEEPEVELVFDGLDTAATLMVNGKMAAHMHNMFRRYAVPVKSYLVVGDNEIVLGFESAVSYAKAQSVAYPYDVPPDCPGPEAHGECHNNFIRKEASSFSWDWGPSFPTAGIWKEVRLVAYSRAMIAQVATEVKTVPEKGGDVWTVDGAVYFDVRGEVEGRVCAGVADGDQALGRACVTCSLGDARDTCRFVIDIDPQRHIERWWPNGEGKQKMYTLEVTWTSRDAREQQEHETYTGRIAFRTVELVQEPIAHSTGLSFYFKINGKPIFMKGSNWIPADSFQERLTLEYLRKLLTSAQVANMNMLRVWGGGVYESDTFYELADELGILIWQDFMFACALYPTDDDFLDNVQEEVTYQVRRLKWHPSIVAWAGNNENEGALASNWYGVKKQDMPRYYADYKKLYLDTVQRVVEREDTSRPFVSSSPSNGEETVKEGGIAKNPQDEHWGDVHYYNYYADGWNYSAFPTPRFASEFGFQSWCSGETLVPVSLLADRRMRSNFTEHRQHHPDGNAQLVQEISQHLNMTDTGDPARDFLHFIYLSQLNQAVSIKTEAEHYRRMQSSVTADGRGHTMGSLYWQLNDIWQAPTWASIEYGGKWKMLHYYARNFYNPVLISPALRPDDTIDVYIVNDSLPVFPANPLPRRYDVSRHDDVLRFEGGDRAVDIKSGVEMAWRNDVTDMRNDVRDMQNDVRDMRLARDGGSSLGVTMYSWDSLTPLKSWTVPFSKTLTVASEIVFHSDIKTLLKETNCPSVDHCLLYFGLDDCSATNWLLLSNFTTAQGLKKANVQVAKVSVLSSTTLSVTLTTDAIAPFVWLELPGFHGYFSDNGFIMVEASLTLTYTSFSPFTPDIAVTPKSFTVQSLMDIYSK